MRRIETLMAVLLLLAAAGCTTQGEVTVYPDYRDVTVPCNIAPLNFHYSGHGRAETIFECDGASLRVRGRNVRIDQNDWKELLGRAAGREIHVSSSLLGEWDIHVSTDSIDRYITYRLIEPGYEVWDRVEIMERDLSNFNERAISSWKNTGNSCMNCHVHKGNNSLFYLRGDKGGAILNRNGELRKLSLKNDDMISSTVYGELNPDDRWGVFSTNIIIPGFHTQPLRRLEVFDTASDLTIADFDNNRMLNPPVLAQAEKFETFPCFSADGRTIFYCSADTVAVPASIEKLQYSLMKVTFDPESGEVGTPEKIWDGPAHGKSVCHPKASPDGKWIMFTIADYGTFPIWHRECDLVLMELESGQCKEMATVNSDRSDTYHSWSSNSRWFVFASKRGDGQYGKPYICHIDEDGLCSKPFLMPQEDPHHYVNFLKSYNIPDLGPSPVPFDSGRIADIRENAATEQFK